MAALRTRAATAALLVLAAALPAALALDCAGVLKTAISACHDQMDLAMLAAAGVIPSTDAITDKTGRCCKAAAALFNSAYMAECACTAEVLAITTRATPAALETMRGLVGDRCSVDAAKFPTCPAAALASVGANANNPPPGGNGAFCKSEKCKSVCPSKYSDPAKYKAASDKLVQTCNTKKANGICVPIPANETNQADYPGHNGKALCSVKGGGTSVANTNATINGEVCTTCCKPIGDIIKRVRGNIDEYKQPISRAMDKNVCSDAASRGCFPGAARVTLAGGATKALSELAVGDKVLTVGADGARAFEDVVFFDHELASGSYSFVRLNLVSGAALELTAGHFVPVGAKLAEAVMTRARDVKAGDAVFVLPAGAAAAEPTLVDSVEAVTRKGMFAPVTTGGRVVVDGVVASSYSDWILDPLFDLLGAPEKLPAAMHAVHAPLRWGYAALGPKVLRALSPIISGIAQLDARQIAAGLRMHSA